MDPATATLIIQGVATLAPYLAQLGQLATKHQAGEPVTAADLAMAEAARRTAFAALERQLTPIAAGTGSAGLAQPGA